MEVDNATRTKKNIVFLYRFFRIKVACSWSPKYLNLELSVQWFAGIFLRNREQLATSSASRIWNYESGIQLTTSSTLQGVRGMLPVKAGDVSHHAGSRAAGCSWSSGSIAIHPPQLSRERCYRWVPGNPWRLASKKYLNSCIFWTTST